MENENKHKNSNGIINKVLLLQTNKISQLQIKLSVLISEKKKIIVTKVTCADKIFCNNSSDLNK